MVADSSEITLTLGVGRCGQGMEKAWERAENGVVKGGERSGKERERAWSEGEKRQQKYIMSKHLKSIIIERLSSTIAMFEELPAGTRHSRGVRYFRANTLITMVWGAMDMEKEGRKYKKRIVVRPSRFRDGLFELYTYHFPKQWSSACVANRELIKEAQRRAHILEHDYSAVGLEWRIRFFRHYFRVFKGGAKPEEGLKPYSRFYQYTYVSIYRQLQKEREREEKEDGSMPITDEISFEPVEFRPSLPSFSSPFKSAYNYFIERKSQPPEIQVFTVP